MRHKTDSLTAVCSLQGEFPDDGGAGHHRNMSKYEELMDHEVHGA